jgi:hypothetical protein
MSDLFDDEPSQSADRTSLGDKFGKVRKNLTELLPRLNRSSEVRSPNFPPIEGGKSSVAAPKRPNSIEPRTRQNQKVDWQELRTRQKNLENEIEVLEADRPTFARLDEAGRLAFQDAHEALLMLHQRRNAGASISKETMMAGYDRRMNAGHAWHPHRKRLKDIDLELVGVREELKLVNWLLGGGQER